MEKNAQITDLFPYYKSHYEIRPKLNNEKTRKSLHILTNNAQYGYKENVAAFDAIVKNEQYIGHDAE